MTSAGTSDAIQAYVQLRDGVVAQLVRLTDADLLLWERQLEGLAVSWVMEFGSSPLTGRPPDRTVEFKAIVLLRSAAQDEAKAARSSLEVSVGVLNDGTRALWINDARVGLRAEVVVQLVAAIGASLERRQDAREKSALAEAARAFAELEADLP